MTTPPGNVRPFNFGTILPKLLPAVVTSRAAFLAQIIGYITGRVSKDDLRRAEETDTDWDDGD